MGITVFGTEIAGTFGSGYDDIRMSFTSVYDSARTRRTLVACFVAGSSS